MSESRFIRFDKMCDQFLVDRVKVALPLEKLLYCTMMTEVVVVVVVVENWTDDQFQEFKKPSLGWSIVASMGTAVGRFGHSDLACKSSR